MHAHQYPEDSRLVGFSLGFYEAIRNGYKTIEFGGHLPCFSSKISLLPEKNIGIFIAINTDTTSSGKVCNEYIDLVYRLLTGNHLAEISDPNPVPFDMDIHAINGRYSFSEYGETDFSKTKAVMLTCRVQCENDGSMKFSSSDFNWKFQYVGNGMFYCSENGYYCRFARMSGKQVINILGFDYVKLSKAEWIVFVISLISQPVFMVFALFLIISRRKEREQDTRFGRTIKMVLILNSALSICYFILNAITSLLYFVGDTSLLFDVIQPVTPAVCWSYAGITIVSTAFVGFVWIRNKTGLKVKIALSILNLLYFPTIIFMYLMNGMKK